MRKTIIFGCVRVARQVRKFLFHHERTYRLLFLPHLESARWVMGKWKAWYAFDRARKVVPAYNAFVGSGTINVKGWNPDLSVLPVMDKESYIKKYSLEQRCAGGSIPAKGVVIDESSGTSGIPNNWVRGPEERQDVKHILQISFHHLVGTDKVFIINSFALGPWATGMNVSMSFVDIGIMKSVGPDVQKIENTLLLFGPSYQYVIFGYPPFLKTLVDTAKIDWSKYKITAICGGEGITEGMRDYLCAKAFTKVIASYGASDLEINIAAESNFTVSLRKFLAQHPDVAKKIFRHAGLPMIFQYNPLDYYIENNAEGELLVTICRAQNISPKIRYNIHDLGHVMRYPELVNLFKEAGAHLPAVPETDLPLLFHYGRADNAVAFYGCKITPADMHDVIFAIPALAGTVNSFSLMTHEDKQVNKKLVIAFELTQGKKAPQNMQKVVLEKLKVVNQDFRESSHMIPKNATPKIVFYAYGTGPFAQNDIRLKKHYIQ